MTPTSGRSCCTCQSRGTLDNFFPFRPPGALFNPYFPPPPFPMHPQLAAAAAAGFPSPPPGIGPEQYLGRDPVSVQECSQHRTGNGVAAAAALQYQNESEFLLLDPHSKQLRNLPAYIMIRLYSSHKKSPLCERWSNLVNLNVCAALGHMFAHYVEAWKSWYLQATSMSNPSCFESPLPGPRPSPPQSPSQEGQWVKRHQRPQEVQSCVNLAESLNLQDCICSRNFDTWLPIAVLGEFEQYIGNLHGRLPIPWWEL